MIRALQLHKSKNGSNLHHAAHLVLNLLMPTFELAKIIPCPLEEAWDAVVDFPARTIHNERYRQAELPDGAQPSPGHRIQLQIGRDRFTSIVTTSQKPSTFSHRTIGPGFWAEYSYRVRLCDEIDPGYSNEDFGFAYLTIRAEYGGWLGSLIAKLRPSACRRYLDDEMSAILSVAASVRAEPVGQNSAGTPADAGVTDVDA